MKIDVFAAIPSAVLTPVVDVSVKLFWTEEVPTTKLVSVPLTVAVRPETLLSAEFSSASVETCPAANSRRRLTGRFA